MDYSAFRAEVARRGMSNRSLADELCLSEQALYNKLNGRTEFKNSEIKKLAALLSLSMDDVNLIFFDGGVN